MATALLFDALAESPIDMASDADELELLPSAIAPSELALAA